MSSGRDREAAHQRAQQHFTVAEQREAAVRAEIDKERAHSAEKTIRLRALRLAKEATDRATEEAETAKKAAAKPAKRAKKRAPAGH
jgi:hypothetical protein